LGNLAKRHHGADRGACTLSLAVEALVVVLRQLSHSASTSSTRAHTTSADCTRSISLNPRMSRHKTKRPGVMIQGSADCARASRVIKHVIVIFGENVSFDHYFGTYLVAENRVGEVPFKARATK